MHIAIVKEGNNQAIFVLKSFFLIKILQVSREIKKKVVNMKYQTPIARSFNQELIDKNSTVKINNNAANRITTSDTDKNSLLSNALPLKYEIAKTTPMIRTIIHKTRMSKKASMMLAYFFQK